MVLAEHASSREYLVTDGGWMDEALTRYRIQDAAIGLLYLREMT